MNTPQNYIVLKDGQEVGRTRTDAEAVHLIHRLQPHSTNYAIMFGGYDVVDPNGSHWSWTTK
jgi:hypothetical protein